MRWRAIAIVLALALAACHRQPPAPAAFAPKAALSAYLAGVYGAHATRDKAWTDDVGEDRVERRVCAFGPAGGDPRGRWLLAVCGEWLAGGHGSPGLIDFHLLEPTGEGFHPTAVARDQGFGSDGHPGTVTLVQLGRQRAGFVVEEGWMGQGIAIGTRSIEEFRDGTLRELATVRSTLDNGGACADDADCARDGFALEFTQAFDASEPAADAYPMLVHETGRECGAVVDRQHRIDFDAAAGRYRVPDALMREDCLQDNDTDSGAHRP